MRSIKDLIDYVKRIEWAYQYISTTGVVPASLAWELIEEIKEREADGVLARAIERINMEIKEYLLFVANKLEEAAGKGDNQEWIRLAEVLIDTLQEQINRLKK